jgi:hypothetical protein
MRNNLFPRKHSLAAALPGFADLPNPTWPRVVQFPAVVGIACT